MYPSKQTETIYYHVIRTKAQRNRGEFQDLKIEMTGHEAPGKECMAVECHLASLMRLSVHNSEYVVLACTVELLKRRIGTEEAVACGNYCRPLIRDSIFPTFQEFNVTTFCEDLSVRLTWIRAL